jgi:ATP-dependent DNA helicase RecQ
MGARRTRDAIDARAREQLGFDTLLDEQRRAISASVEGRDVLVVMPTGSGKSAIYQLTGEMRDGPTIIVSPLVALQHDQVGSIESSELSDAAALNSLIGARAFRDTLAAAARGDLEFLFVAPEQLAKPDVVESLAAAHPSLFVVDEAHCISTWGHSFRPDYLRLGDVAAAVGRPPVLALTATAAPPVRAEIVDRVGMTDALVVTSGFDRPEIDLRVDRFTTAIAKLDALVSDVVHRNGPGIVYVATRRHATIVTDALRERGVEVAMYHGALARRERERIHSSFLDGSVRVVVATNAFGMGIDKPDVRFVFHFDVPGSLDAYYQEIGRAGRDGEDAEAILYYDADDLSLQKFFAGGKVDEEVFARVLAAAHRATGASSLRQLAEEAEVSKSRASVAVDALARAGALVRDRRGRVSGVRADDVPAAVEAAVEAEDVRERVERSRIEMMRAYAETTWCRRALLVGYYGEDYEPPCGRCDNCRAGLVAPLRSAPLFLVGTRVTHPEWGDGAVMINEDERVVVLFDTAGYRALSVALVRDNDLLRRAS